MGSKLKFRTYLTSKPFWISLLLLLSICAGLIVFARTRSSKHPFELAEDFPRGALVYGQFSDLPALIKQWDQSRLKQQYLESENYKQFQHGHLALKLIERWEEFNNALGFPLDAAALSSTADNRVAIAIYDIGRLDLIFIAPMSEEKIMATEFFKSKEQFEATELPDGTTYYRHEVEADRGRQKQMLVFAALKGRLILATSEPLLLRAIANINGKSKKDRLWDDPAFKTLSAITNPHFATVWVDQAKLNADYYFKHYWLMRNVDQLKAIRACMFDLELKDGTWIERRDYLSAGKAVQKNSPISAAEIARLQAQIPGDVPFLNIKSLADDAALTTSLIQETLLDRPANKQNQSGKYWSWERYGDDEFYPDDNDEGDDHYSYLSPEFDSVIDDPGDAKISQQEEPGENPLRSELERQFAERLQQALAPAHPLAAVVATSPRTTAGPLFVEFRRIAILPLQAPTNLNRQFLEDAISKAAQSRLTVAGPSVDLKWVDHSESNQPWRELELPMLGWHFCYAQRGSDLIIANSPEFLSSILSVPKQPAASAGQSASSLDDLTVIRVDQRKSAFDDIVNRLDAESIKRSQAARKKDDKEASGKSEEFFSGNISSLLDVASNVTRIEIKRSSSSNSLHEEIDYILK
ncbi:MAG TPA: hypothetical protein VGO56_16020 [Pyrinomonadaceae bacterium]|nr:hypothetical protein [Pyrinomonadaceae bacterium]